MENRRFGYIRVSSVDQNELRQLVALTRCGIPREMIYIDKCSGKDFNRPQYQLLKSQLREGDVLMVQSIDRLGRSYEEIQQEWREIVKELHADIAVLDMPLLDTRRSKDLVGTLISDIVLQLLSYVAQSERESIRRRQAEGIAAAKAQGKHLGRFPDPIPPNFAGVYRDWSGKRISRREAMARLNMTENQFSWMVRKYRKQLQHCAEEIP